MSSGHGMLRAMSRLPDWHLRRAVESDVPALAALYADTARRMGARCYTPQQVDAWASFGADLAVFRAYVLGATTWLAQARPESGPLGFCGVDGEGEVRSFYVRADCARCGLGSALLRHALAVAAQRGVLGFAAWATPFSKPLFERAGFELERVVCEPYQGVLFDRYRMRRQQ
jgi:putative acetyltransferase